MKILFVCSGNKGHISPIIKNQGDSLVKQDRDVKYFAIQGKGLLGYLKNVIPLRNYIKKNGIDVVHAHYSLSAFVASLAGAHPLVVSLMGSDVKASIVYKFIICLFAHIFKWKKIIVKSDDMYKTLRLKNAQVIPNGVDLMRFRQLDKKMCHEILGWNTGKKHVVFPSNPQRHEKNYGLAEDAMSYLSGVEMHTMVDVPNVETPLWYNAADVVVMTSLWEGSPNAIKEAMACNCPVVTVDVGDVKERLAKVQPSAVVERNTQCIASALRTILEQGERSNGRKELLRQGLDNRKVAEKLIQIYNNILNKV